MKRGDIVGKAYVKVGSVTHAIKAKDVLNANGIRAQIVRNTINNKNESCGYLVAVNSDISRVESLVVILQENVLGRC